MITGAFSGPRFFVAFSAGRWHNRRHIEMPTSTLMGPEAEISEKRLWSPLSEGYLKQKSRKSAFGTPGIIGTKRRKPRKVTQVCFVSISFLINHLLPLLIAGSYYSLSDILMKVYAFILV